MSPLATTSDGARYGADLLVGGLGVLLIVTALLLRPSGDEDWIWPSGDRAQRTLSSNGVLEWTDGRRYTGAFANGIPSGRGQMEWPDGSVYVGAFEAGYPHGQGTLTTASGLRYRGRFVAGAVQGNGELQGPFGVYRGAVEAGIPSGRGALETAAGDRFSGQFEAGVPHGEGRLDLAQGMTLRGRFSVGRHLGNLEVLYPDGGRYTGPWRGARVGRGTMRWPSGRRYNGLWASDAPNDAAGSFSWPDGRRFIGPVQTGLPEGEGWCIDLDVTERCSYRAGVRGGPSNAPDRAANGL